MFFIYRLDILAIATLLCVAELFLHRNKSTETEEVLLVSGTRGGLRAQARHATVSAKCLCKVGCHVLTQLRRDSVGEGAISGRETLLDQTLCS